MEYSVCTCRWTNESLFVGPVDTVESLLKIASGQGSASAPSTPVVLGKGPQPTTAPGPIVAATADIPRVGRSD
jgi:hypothetical protein